MVVTKAVVKLAANKFAPINLTVPPITFYTDFILASRSFTPNLISLPEKLCAPENHLIQYMDGHQTAHTDSFAITYCKLYRVVGAP